MEMDVTNPPDVLGSVEETVLRKPWRSVPVRTYDGKRMHKNLGQNHFCFFLGDRSAADKGIDGPETKERW